MHRPECFRRVASGALTEAETALTRMLGGAAQVQDFHRHGVALPIVGVNSSHSVADRLSHTFTGRFTCATNWYIVGGIALAVLGLLLGIMGFRGKNAA